MSEVIKLEQDPHRQVEAIKEKARNVESLVILCENSIRFHAIPELQHVADVLETLFQPLWEMGNDAEVLEKVLYQEFNKNNGKSSLNYAIKDSSEGGAK